MTAEYEIRTTELTVVMKGKELFDESSTQIKIDDEAGGEFVTISQHGCTEYNIRIDPAEWDTIKNAVDLLVKDCR